MASRQLQLVAPHNNQQLFSDYYLNEKLPEHPRWRALAIEAEPVRATIARILSDLGSPDSKLNNKLAAWWNLDFSQFRAEIKKAFKREIPLRAAFSACATRYASSRRPSSARSRCGSGTSGRHGSASGAPSTNATPPRSSASKPN